MYSGQQNPQGNQQYPQQPYQQYPQQQPGYPPQQYQQAPAQTPQPAPQPAPQVPAGPAKDTIVADEFKKYIASITWQVGDHQQYPGQHIIKISPPAGKKPAKGDVKKGQITIRAMGPQAPMPGAPPSGANSIQVNVDTEEKAGFFGSDKKSYPLWLNADEEVDNSMQPTTGLRDKIRNILTQAKVVVPPPPPPPPPPPAAPAPAPQQWGQPQPGAPVQAAAQPAPAYQQQPAPQYQQPAPQPAYQQQPAPQYQQPAPQQPASQQQPAPQYQQQPAQQYGAPAQGYPQKTCANPNCRTVNAPNTTTCYRCGYQLQ